MNAIKQAIEALVCKELASANEQFPLFNSVHESYAVLLEEAEEAKEAGNSVDDGLDQFWKAIRGNCPMNFLTYPLQVVREQAVQMAIEAIQVAAMCDKFTLSFVSDSLGGVNHG
jgi:hypothetical protein